MADLLEAAREELERCRTEEDPEDRKVACQQAAEKIWAHVHRAGREALDTRDRSANQKIKETLGRHRQDSDDAEWMFERYSAIEERLHGDCFYDEMEYACDPDFIENFIDDADRLADSLRHNLPRW